MFVTLYIEFKLIKCPEIFRMKVTFLQPSILLIGKGVCFIAGSTSKSRRASDIISMLVNIYGSKELFVQEYRTLLADRILTQFNYEIVKEIRYLELLKLRFGESQLHYCEVMLKDVADSKRLNSRVMDERMKAAKREVKNVSRTSIQYQLL